MLPIRKAALAQASAFAGGFDLPAAEVVLDLSPWPEAPWAVDVVTGLADKSLLRIVSRVAGTDDPRFELDEPFFGMYVSVQAYAAEKLRTVGAVPGDASGPDVERTVWLRHAEHYSGLCPPDDPHPPDSRRERANVLIAFDRVETIGDARLLGRLAFAGNGVLYQCREASEVRIQLVLRALRHPDLPADDRARLHSFVANLRVSQGRPDDAMDHMTRSVAAAEAENNQDLLTQMRAESARVLQGAGRYAEAEALCRELLEGDAPLTDWLSGLLRGQRVFALMALGRQSEAWEEAERLRVLAETVDGPGMEVVRLNLYGLFSRRDRAQGKLAEAVAWGEKALAAAEAADHGYNASVARVVLGSLATDRGDYATANELYLQVLAQGRKSGSSDLIIYPLWNLALNLSTTGRLDEALVYLHQALEHAQRLRLGPAIARTLYTFSTAYGSAGRLGDARRYLEQVQALLLETPNPELATQVALNTTHLYLDLGLHDQAREAIAEGRRLAAEAGREPWLPGLLVLEAWIDIRDGRFEEAHACAEQLAATPSADQQTGALLAAVALAHLGRGAEARALVQEWESHEVRRGTVHLCLAYVWLLLDEPELLERALTDGERESIEHGLPIARARFLELRARWEIRRGDPDAARGAIDEALRLSRECGVPHDGWLPRQLRAHLACLGGDPGA